MSWKGPEEACVKESSIIPATGDHYAVVSLRYKGDTVSLYAAFSCFFLNILLRVSFVSRGFAPAGSALTDDPDSLLKKVVMADQRASPPRCIEGSTMRSACRARARASDYRGKERWISALIHEAP